MSSGDFLVKPHQHHQFAGSDFGKEDWILAARINHLTLLPSSQLDGEISLGQDLMDQSPQRYVYIFTISNWYLIFYIQNLFRTCAILGATVVLMPENGSSSCCPTSLINPRATGRLNDPRMYEPNHHAMLPYKETVRRCYPQ